MHHLVRAILIWRSGPVCESVVLSSQVTFRKISENCMRSFANFYQCGAINASHEINYVWPMMT